MSLRNAARLSEKDDRSTVVMTTSHISSDCSVESQYVYDEEFTLMAKQAPKQQLQNRNSCLAIKMAEKFPPKIKEEVVKMAQYYEEALATQLKHYHRLVEENTKIRKENQRLKAQNLANQLDQAPRVPKENRVPLMPLQNKPQIIEKTPERVDLRERIDELQEKVILRDKKINELNSEIGDLTLKLRKYRKRFQSTGIRCD